MSLGLYLHVPFCRALCNYCNFNRGLFNESLKRQYVAALITEVRRAGERSRAAADTVYFGGGTPSLLDPREVAGVIAACRDSFDLAADAEITLEANPETVDAARLDGFRRAGVNRLSFGVQSFHDGELDRLSRLHSAAEAREAFAGARAAGFDNVSLDLMMWLPGQTVESWLESVEALVALDPDHASLYLLELYPQAPLNEVMARAGWSQAPDDAAAEMYGRAMARLDDAGYEQYEISNVARPGRRSRHNLKYWTDGEWLGFGCGAHSTRGGVRWKNVPATEEYVRRVTAGAGVAAEHHRLSAAERLGDAMFTGLRLNDGVQVEAIAERYGADIWHCYGEQLQPYLEAGLLRCEDGRLQLTRRGMLLAHEVMTVFV
jgi:oxygen-independent coproporphyrinogen III oxidase